MLRCGAGRRWRRACARCREQGRLVVSRVIRRLIPFIFLCYVVAYIDRVNIGFNRHVKTVNCETVSKRYKK